MNVIKMNKDADDWADELFEIFKTYSTEVGGVMMTSNFGLDELSHTFGQVPEDERGYVFLSFLANLRDAEYGYDMQKFLNMEARE